MNQSHAHAGTDNLNLSVADPPFLSRGKTNCTTFVVIWDLSLVTQIFKRSSKSGAHLPVHLLRRISSVPTFQTDTQIVGSPPECAMASIGTVIGIVISL